MEKAIWGIGKPKKTGRAQKKVMDETKIAQTLEEAGKMIIKLTESLIKVEKRVVILESKVSDLEWRSNNRDRCPS